MLKCRAFCIALVFCSLFIVAPSPVHANLEENSEDDSAFTESETEAGLPEETPDVELNLEKTKNDKKTIIRTVRRSDSLLGILTSNGFKADEVYNFLALPSWPKHYVLAPSSRYLVSTFSDSQKVELIFFMQRSPQVLKLTKDEGKTEFSISDLNFELRVRQVSGDVQGSLYSSLRRLVPDGWIISRFSDAYSLDYKLDKQVRRGAKFTITYEEKLLNGQYVAPGEVLYTAVDIDGRKQERFFLKSNQGGAFLAVDEGHEARPFYAPIEYLHISSPFNLKRFHPIRRRRVPHKGTDFALNHGSTVYAALEGTVTRMGRNKAAGMFVVLKHKNGYQTDYVHLSQLESRINVGTEVKAGQKLGEVGCTGFCTRPHLHFGISKNGVSLDPIKYLKPYTFVDEPQFKSFAECLSGKSDQRNPTEACVVGTVNNNKNSN